MARSKQTRTTARKTAIPLKKEFFVFDGDHQDVKHPKSVHLCPLGLQFYSPKPMADCTLLEFNIELPGRGKTRHQVKCTGAVVKCESEKKKQYRVWIKFLDMPTADRRRIEGVSKNGKNFSCWCGKLK